MSRLAEDAVRDLPEASDLTPELAGLAAANGHDGAVYMHFGHTAGPDDEGRMEPRRLAHSPGFAGARYRRSGWLAHDPFAARARRNHTPFAWSLENTEVDGPKAAALIQMLRAGGLLWGVVAPVQDYAQGSAMVMLFAREPRAEISQTRGGLMLDAALLHVRALAVLDPQDKDDSALNARELDVLRLAALGRTERETADALGLTRRGVQFHLARAMSRLGVANKTAAVARAVGAGLIRL